MSINFSNAKVGVKVSRIFSKNNKAYTEEAETTHQSWEFFKKVRGIFTDFIPAQINIPSTAITPSFQLPTKETFSNIMLGISVFKQLKTKIEVVSSVFDGSAKKHAMSRKDEYVRILIHKELKNTGW